jgi:AraC-like DNA-binding protein
MPKLVRSASLTNYIEVARSVGLDPDRMLERFGLARHCLRNPDLKIREEAVRGLLEASAEAAGIEDFGLRMAETRALSNLGALALLVRDQPTVRKALEVWIEYRKVHTDSVSLHIEESRDDVIISLVRSVETRLPKRQTVELTIGVLCRMLRFYLGEHWQPQVCLMHTAPRSRDTHRRVLGAKLEFSADFNGIICRASDLDAPIPMADPAMAQYAQRYLDSIARRDESFSEKVRELVMTLLSSGHCRMERVAEHLGIDRKTVHRRLAQEGTSFSAIVDGVRTQTVSQHIEDRERPLSDVAEMLGFSDVSAFSRWFKRRFGRSVSEWRATYKTNGMAHATAPPVNGRKLRMCDRATDGLELPGFPIQRPGLAPEFRRQPLVKHAFGRDHRDFGCGVSDGEEKGLQLTEECAAVEFEQVPCTIDFGSGSHSRPDCG